MRRGDEGHVFKRDRLQRNRACFLGCFLLDFRSRLSVVAALPATPAAATAPRAFLIQRLLRFTYLFNHRSFFLDLCWSGPWFERHFRSDFLGRRSQRRANWRAKPGEVFVEGRARPARPEECGRLLFEFRKVMHAWPRLRL